MVSSNINEKVEKIIPGKTTREEAMGIFGKPEEYIWDEEIFSEDSLPDGNYIMVYDVGVDLCLADDTVWEVRIESNEDYSYEGKIGLGSSVEDVISFFGEPSETTTGKPIYWQNNVLYRDVDGETGQCYIEYDNAGVRMFFMSYKVCAFYLFEPEMAPDLSGDQIKELERRRNSIMDVSPKEAASSGDYVGTWKTCGFSSGGIGADKWLHSIKFENSTIRYLHFFANGDLWITGDWTREKGWPFDRRVVAVVKNLHSWDGQSIVHMYGKLDHPEKRDFRLVNQDDRLYFSWHEQEDTYYVFEKISDSPETEVIK